MKCRNYDEMSLHEIMCLLDKMKLCRLCVSENNQPYCIPMFFQYCYESGEIIFILESVTNGKKMRAIENNCRVSLEFDTQIGCCIESVVVTGIAKIDDIPCEEFLNIRVMISCISVTGRKYFL